MGKISKIDYAKIKREALDNLIRDGYKIVTDKSRNLSIAYNIDNLFNANDTLSQPYLVDSSKVDEFMNITHEEVLKRIEKLKVSIEYTLDELINERLFDYLPLTNNNCFHKGRRITIYRPNIKFTCNEEYFNQYEVALQITPMYFHEEKVLDDLAILEINDHVSLSKVVIEDILDDEGVFKKPTMMRNTYLPEISLEPGSLYKDAKGFSYLYLGSVKIINKNIIPMLSSSHCYKNPYIKLTSKWMNVLKSCKNMNEFIMNIIEDAIKKDILYRWEGTLKRTSHAKFIEKEAVYFSGSHATINIDGYVYHDWEIYVKSL